MQTVEPRLNNRLGPPGEGGRVCARACVCVRASMVCRGKGSGRTVKLSSKTARSPNIDCLVAQAQEKVDSFPLSLLKFTLKFNP